LEILREGCQNARKEAVGRESLPALLLETEMILEDLEHRGEELKKRIEMVRSYL